MANRERTFGEVIPNGKKIRLNLLDVNLMVLADDSHPTNEERAEQLTRLLGVIKAHYNPSNTFAAEFIKAYDAANTKAQPDLKKIKATWNVFPEPVKGEIK